MEFLVFGYFVYLSCTLFFEAAKMHFFENCTCFLSRAKRARAHLAVRSCILPDKKRSAFSV